MIPQDRESQLSVIKATGRHASFVMTIVPGAITLDAQAFRQCTIQAYQAIQAALTTGPHRAPVRFWNHLPNIHQAMGDQGDRYMVFNSGRFAAMNDWLGGETNFSRLLPTASGVGHAGNDLIVQCLALAQPGDIVENPRQIPAWKYSVRYGPVPPSFSRATVATNPLEAGRTLIVAGTASIRGEQSMHAGDLGKQLDETLTNLRSLLRAAGSAGDDLSAFTDVRAYHVNASDAGFIERALRVALGPVTHIELFRADLCRADLLVEIEGLATLPKEARHE